MTSVVKGSVVEGSGMLVRRMFRSFMKMGMNVQPAGMLVGMDVKGGAAAVRPKNVCAKGHQHHRNGKLHPQSHFFRNLNP